MCGPRTKAIRLRPHERKALLLSQLAAGRGGLLLLPRLSFDAMNTIDPRDDGEQCHRIMTAAFTALAGAGHAPSTRQSASPRRTPSSHRFAGFPDSREVIEDPSRPLGEEDPEFRRW